MWTSVVRTLHQILGQPHEGAWSGGICDIRNVYKIVVRKHEGRRPLGRPCRRWEDNTEVGPREHSLRARAGFIWLSIGTDNVLIWTSELHPAEGHALIFSRDILLHALTVFYVVKEAFFYLQYMLQTRCASHTADVATLASAGALSIGHSRLLWTSCEWVKMASAKASEEITVKSFKKRGISGLLDGKEGEPLPVWRQWRIKFRFWRSCNSWQRRSWR